MKNDVQTIKKIFLTEKVIICVQITMSRKSKLYICAKDFYLCVKAIFPFENYRQINSGIRSFSIDLLWFSCVFKNSFLFNIDLNRE